MTVAGAGAYYFAKKSIDADKKTRFEDQQRRRQMAASLENQEMYSRPPTKRDANKKGDNAASPSTEGMDEAAPASQSKTKSRSKYEPTEVYRTRKGDRFS